MVAKGMSSSVVIKRKILVNEDEERYANSGKVKYLDQRGLLLKWCFGHMAAK